ncbi:MAG: dihydropteroate synthase [Actinomycetota bacterium]|nr:dihydropteroate synthase [Actinomycetota bacterium]
MFTWEQVCGARPAVMGIVNVTPDSFSDGGRFLDADAAIAHGIGLAAQGADVLDVGGESTRPGAAPVTARQELARVLPVIEGLTTAASVPVSIDTTKAAVARAALEAGATIVNDVSAGRLDPDILGVTAAAGAGFVAMHMQGEPRTMQLDPRYDDVVGEVGDFLVERVEAAHAAGIARGAVAADPGIGFGKTVEHNLEILAALPSLAAGVPAPLLVGTSRKTFIGRLLARATGASADLPVDQRDEGTLATVVWAVEHGASIVRVHDVTPAVQAIRLVDAMRAAGEGAA